MKEDRDVRPEGVGWTILFFLTWQIKEPHLMLMIQNKSCALLGGKYEQVASDVSCMSPLPILN